MNCDAARVLIHGHLDGELDLASDVEVEQHLEQCPRCTRQYAALGAMRARLKDEPLRFPAPAGMTEKIRATVYAAAPRTRSPSPWRSFFSSAVQFAIPLAIGALLALFVLPHITSLGDNETIAREVVASHVRSMMAAHLMDVASTDQHTVKPWFNGKLDFSPPVTDFAKEGFALVGGRLDYIDNRAVAALVYQHGKHAINVFMWPAAGGTTGAERVETQQGYNVDQTIVAGMDCWIVSDLNRRELMKFAGLLRAGG